MFKIGNYVVNTNNGICEISDITTMKMSGTEKEYYVLVPIEEKTAKVYLPVDIASNRVRLVMSKEDALALIKDIKGVDEAYVENEKERERIYKEAIASHDPKRLISIIKTLYLRKKERMEAGKKNTAVDERYFRLAESHLHNELAFALEISKDEVMDMIVANL